MRDVIELIIAVSILGIFITLICFVVKYFENSKNENEKLTSNSYYKFQKYKIRNGFNVVVNIKNNTIYELAITGAGDGNTLSNILPNNTYSWTATSVFNS